MERRPTGAESQAMDSVADVARQDDLDIERGPGGTTAVGDAVQAGVAASPAADEPIMRDRGALELGGTPASAGSSDADDLPSVGVPA